MPSIAKKLKNIRVSQGLTLEQAAKSAGFRNFQTLSKIEKGTRNIKAEELVALAKAYSFDINLFLLDEPKPKDVRMFWRSDPNPPVDKSAQVKFSLFFERYLYLIKILELSDSNLSLPIQPIGEINLKSADNLGERYAGLLKLGDRPALSLGSILENEHNLPIFYIPLPEGASAISLMANGSAAVCVNVHDVPWRQRFDIAHELFHIIYKKSISDACGKNETSFFEKCANAFAAALLLPKNALEKEIDLRRKKEKFGIATLIAIACDFGVSLPALVWRLVNIRRLKKSLAKEILESDAVKEYDKNLRKHEIKRKTQIFISHKYLCMVFEAVNKGLMSQARAAQYLNIPISKLENVLLNAGLVLKEEADIEITLV
jgi:Zn-dependent peptidase ImmA (M78 family)/transcriptional regulator with XRE-family HTH domain